MSEHTVEKLCKHGYCACCCKLCEPTGQEAAFPPVNTAMRGEPTGDDESPEKINLMQVGGGHPEEHSQGSGDDGARESEHPIRCDCKECGEGIAVDEDGCCVTCGADAIVTEVPGGRWVLLAPTASEGEAGTLDWISLHRPYTNEEHDAAEGKLAGFCVRCRVPWPCQYSPEAITLAPTDPVEPGASQPAATEARGERIEGWAHRMGSHVLWRQVAKRPFDDPRWFKQDLILIAPASPEGVDSEETALQNVRKIIESVHGPSGGEGETADGGFGHEVERWPDGETEPKQ